MIHQMCSVQMAFLLLICISRSSQFVANCMWEDTGAARGSLASKSLMMSDADACALFCSRPNGAAGVVTNTPSTGSPTLCERCCKPGQELPASRPTDILYSILNTVMNAFNSKNPQFSLVGGAGTNTNNPLNASVAESNGTDVSGFLDTTAISLGRLERDREVLETDYEPKLSSPDAGPEGARSGPRNLRIRLDKTTYDSLFHRASGSRSKRSNPVPSLPIR